MCIRDRYSSNSFLNIQTGWLHGISLYIWSMKYTKISSVNKYLVNNVSITRNFIVFITVYFNEMCIRDRMMILMILMIVLTTTKLTVSVAYYSVYVFSCSKFRSNPTPHKRSWYNFFFVKKFLLRFLSSAGVRSFSLSGNHTPLQSEVWKLF